MEDKIEFEELYKAYELCLKNKKKKIGTYNFTNEELCMNLILLLDELNNRTYKTKPSNCYVVTEPALRKIFAAQFGDRIVQHFYMMEVEDVLENMLIDGCCSCRKGKGTSYALNMLKNFLIKTSDNGKKPCFFLKIDLSGYFMSVDWRIVSEKFKKLIQNKSKGKHKELLLYLTPVIFENNPALDCEYKCSEQIRNLIPNRRKMDCNSNYGMAIGNLTAQAGSNLNLNNFDHYVIEELKLDKYIRYVDDIIIISDNKKQLIDTLPLIQNKLAETHQFINKKTKIDTAYHEVPFLGKVSHPYGYQKPSKQVIIRTCQRAKNIQYENEKNLIAKVNSQVGTLKGYNCRKLIRNYIDLLPSDAQNIIKERIKMVNWKRAILYILKKKHWHLRGRMIFYN